MTITEAPSTTPPGATNDDVVTGAPTVWGLIGRGLVFAFFVWFAGMCAYAFLLWQNDQEVFDEQAIEAEGIVVDVHYRTLSGNGGRVTSDPVVTFTTSDGQQVTFVDTSAIDLGVTTGDRVVVRYVPDQPDWARIENASQQTNSAAISVMLVVLTLVSAICAFFAARGLRRAFQRRDLVDVASTGSGAA